MLFCETGTGGKVTVVVAVAAELLNKLDQHLDDELKDIKKQMKICPMIIWMIKKIRIVGLAASDVLLGVGIRALLIDSNEQV